MHMNSHFTAKTASIFLAFVMIFSAFGAGVADAASGQAYYTGSTPVSACITLSHALSYGSRDAVSGGEVSALQNFLIARGAMQASATGFFGPITLNAVEQFQTSQGISAIGIVGPLTRAAIVRVSCGTNQSGVSIYSITPSSGPVGTSVSIVGFGFTNDNTIRFGNGSILHVPTTSSIAITCTTDPRCHGGINQTITFTVPSYLNPPCYYAGCMQPSFQVTPGSYDVSVQDGNGTSNSVTFTVTNGSQTNPALSSLSPNYGPIGTWVTLYGAGFNANDMVLIGGGAVRPSSIAGNGTQLTFVVPNSVGAYCPPGAACPMFLRLLTPGEYQISVEDESNGNTSNSLSLAITGSSSNSAPTITGVDAPAALSVGSTGSWTVHASVPSGSTTNLHYSVMWGDQTNSMNPFVAQGTSNTQTSATFTHSYQVSGTYTAVFTVANDAGQSATVSSTVTVNPIY